jgi:hypothetical protein
LLRIFRDDPFSFANYNEIALSLDSLAVPII